MGYGGDDSELTDQDHALELTFVRHTTRLAVIASQIYDVALVRNTVVVTGDFPAEDVTAIIRAVLLAIVAPAGGTLAKDTPGCFACLLQMPGRASAPSS